MIYLLWWVEKIKDKMVGNDEQERQKKAIKELFSNNEDMKLVEVLIGMVDGYYEKNREDDEMR